MKKFSKEEIKEILIEDSDRRVEADLAGRELVVTPIPDNYGKVDTVVYSLNGSPPRRFGVYQDSVKRLTIFDSRMRKLQSFQEVIMNAV